jgi:nucleotide-binding universal stress UspA family protein
VLKILVAYDGSAEAKRAVEWGSRLGEAKVTVLGVAPTLGGSEVIADSVDPTFELDTFKGELREAAQQLQAAGVAAQAVEKAGNPAATIIETAESGGYDLVVVGVRGRHAIARFLFGSTADRVARHATTPVLVVR